MNGRRNLCASLTVEAALAFPVFFYAVMALCCLFLYMEAGSGIEEAMLETARTVSAYGDLMKEAADRAEEAGTGALLAADAVEGLSVRAVLEENLQEHPVAVHAVEGGTLGISCLGSELYDDDECMHLVCTYRLKTPVPILGIDGPEGVRTVTYRYFTGTKAECLLEPETNEEEPEEEPTVYKTKYGTVYHLSLQCPSLKLNIMETDPDSIGSKRNEYGAKYYPCEDCAKGPVPEIFYYTTDSNRYHYRLNCRGLTRTIIEIKLSEAGNLAPCKRCGKGD